MQLSLPMNIVINFDSASPPAKKDDNPLVKTIVELCEILVGTSYSVNVDKDNHFVSVDGIQQTIEKANTQTPGVVDALKERLDSDRIKKEFETEHGNLPPILVRVGDTWERSHETDLGANQTLTFQNKYEYMGTVEKDGQTLDKVKVTAQAVTYALDSKPNAEVVVKVDKSDLKIASSEGMFLFDRQAGRVVERQNVNRITGTMTININGMELPSKLDLTLDMGSKVTK
jgi:hypothetical protein